MVEEIKGRINLSEVCEALGVAVNGRKALCPLHPDKNPSMTINKDLWYCFVCAKGGDLFNLVMEVKGISFKESIAWVNEAFGLNLTDRKPQRNYYLESLNENYNRLKSSLIDEFSRNCLKFYELDSFWALQYFIYTAKDYNFLETYHERLDEIERQITELENARTNLRRNPPSTKPGRGF